MGAQCLKYSAPDGPKIALFQTEVQETTKVFRWTSHRTNSGSTQSSAARCQSLVIFLAVLFWVGTSSTLANSGELYFAERTGSSYTEPRSLIITENNLQQLPRTLQTLVSPGDRLSFVMNEGQAVGPFAVFSRAGELKISGGMNPNQRIAGRLSVFDRREGGQTREEVARFYFEDGQVRQGLRLKPGGETHSRTDFEDSTLEDSKAESFKNLSSESGTRLSFGETSIQIPEALKLQIRQLTEDFYGALDQLRLENMRRVPMGQEPIRRVDTTAANQIPFEVLVSSRTPADPVGTIEALYRSKGLPYLASANSSPGVNTDVPQPAHTDGPRRPTADFLGAGR
ncbi:MAG: hypothetical protein EA369_06795 [Bradymonadales bacterium]|nr:MAG: hypothetical protein EA369_06795 [Bradymonadales bacterium]